MRTIPLLVNNRYERVIGYLEIDDTISDEELLNSTISWTVVRGKTKKLVAASLVQNKVDIRYEGNSHEIMGHGRKT